MQRNNKIAKCIEACVFWRIHMDTMFCAHPYFDWKPTCDPEFSPFIIDKTMLYEIPEKCPLRTESITVTYILDEKQP